MWKSSTGMLINLRVVLRLRSKGGVVPPSVICWLYSCEDHIHIHTSQLLPFSYFNRHINNKKLIKSGVPLAKCWSWCSCPRIAPPPWLPGGGGSGGGGDGDENIGGGGITPMSVTPRLSWESPFRWWPWPEGVTRSLGSMDKGFTASFTGEEDNKD